MDIALAVERLVPNAEYFGSTETNNNTAWKAVEWKDSRKKPSWGDLVSAYGEIEQEQQSAASNPGSNNIKQRIDALEKAVAALEEKLS